MFEGAGIAAGGAGGEAGVRGRKIDWKRIFGMSAGGYIHREAHEHIEKIRRLIDSAQISLFQPSSSHS